MEEERLEEEREKEKRRLAEEAAEREKRKQAEKKEAAEARRAQQRAKQEAEAERKRKELELRRLQQRQRGRATDSNIQHGQGDLDDEIIAYGEESGAEEAFSGDSVEAKDSHSEWCSDEPGAGVSTSDRLQEERTARSLAYEQEMAELKKQEDEEQQMRQRARELIDVKFNEQFAVQQNMMWQNKLLAELMSNQQQQRLSRAFVFSYFEKPKPSSDSD